MFACVKHQTHVHTKFVINKTTDERASKNLNYFCQAVEIKLDI